MTEACSPSRKKGVPGWRHPGLATRLGGGLTASAQGCYKVLFPGGPLAQLVEHLTLNQKVLGSIPRRLTTSCLKNAKFLRRTPSASSSRPVCVRQVSEVARGLPPSCGGLQWIVLPHDNSQ